MRQIFLLVAAINLQACSTLQTMSPILTGTKAVVDNSKYVNVFQTTHDSPTQTSLAAAANFQRLDLTKWLYSASKTTSPKSCHMCDATDKYLIEFENLGFDTKAKYRRQLIDTVIRYSDNNCEMRQDSVGAILSTGNVTTSLLGGIANTVGSLTTDTLTSRAASAISGGANKLWAGAQKEFLAGGEFEKSKSRVKDARDRQKKIIDDKVVKVPSSKSEYQQWPLSAAIRALDEYDRMCDMFD